MKPQISVAITSWARSPFRLNHLVWQIQMLKQITNEPIKIYVVDNGGEGELNHNQKEILHQFLHTGMIDGYASFPLNKGAGYARNLLSWMVDTTYICLLDNDIVLDPNWMYFSIKYARYNHVVSLLHGETTKYHKFLLRKKRGVEVRTRASGGCLVMKTALARRLVWGNDTKPGSRMADQLNKMGIYYAVPEKPLAFHIGVKDSFDYRRTHDFTKA